MTSPRLAVPVERPLPTLAGVTLPAVDAPGGPPTSAGVTSAGVTSAGVTSAGPTGAGLVVRTTRVPDPRPLLDLLPEQDALAWVRDGDGLVGWGTAARCELSGPDRFADAERWWAATAAAAAVEDEVGLPGSGLVAFGSFAFDDDPTGDDPTGEEHPGRGSGARRGTSLLIVPEVVVGRRGDVCWITTVGAVAPLVPRRPPVRPAGGARFSDGSRSRASWVQLVREAVHRIELGEVDKVVLARDVRAELPEPLDLRSPLQRLARDYRECWTFCVDGLLGATPEVLVRLRSGVATSRVLAGTLRRSGDLNRDLRQSDALARSIKDVEEHGYGVRSVADALARHCAAVDVPAAPFVLELPNVLHLATDVRGVVSDGSTSLGLVASLHPSAAVCGTPTEAARALIRRLEGLDRGRYAGPVGWLDAAGGGEWGIALRCAQVEPDDPCRLRLFAGCGIVAGSKAPDELAESSAKLVPMRTALGAPPAPPR